MANEQTKNGGFRRKPLEREKEKSAEGVIYGRNSVRELLRSGRSIDKIFIREGDRDGSVNVIIAEAAARKIPLIETEKQKLDKMCAGGVHQGVVAMVAEKEYCTLDDILEIARARGEMPFIAILDGVEDPYNLGAVIRCADCAGVHGIVIPKRRAVGLTPAVSKSSAGALEHVAIAKVANLASEVDKLKAKGIWIYAAEAGGYDVHEVDVARPAAFIFGSEGNGVSRLLKEKSDYIVSVPMFGKVNSMNVSTAAAVVLTEAAYRRNKK